MAANVRRIVAEFSAKNKAKGEMASFRRDIDSAGQTMRRMATGALALAGIGGGLYALKHAFMGVVKAASDAEETQAKFDTVFKALSEQANAWAESFGRSVGRSKQSVKSWMAGLQDTFVPLGIARNEALELAKSLTKLAVDVASFNNAVDANVIRDFTSALVGNHETVRKFGIIISESALKQEAMRQGINKTYKELTDLEKVQLRYNLILSGTTDAQGDALRTADSYANQVKRLTGEYENLKVELGSHVIPVLTDVIGYFNELIEQHNRLKDIPWFPKREVGPPVIEKWQQQLEESPLVKAAKEFHEIEVSRMKDLIEEGRKYWRAKKAIEEESKAMQQHRMDMLEKGGTLQEMEWRRDTERIRLQMEAETKAREKAAQDEKELLAARADAYRDMYGEMGRMTEDVYAAQSKALRSLYKDYEKAGVAEKSRNKWLEEQTKIIEIKYLKATGGIAGGFQAAGMQIKREIKTWGDIAYEFSMSFQDSIASGLESTMRDFDNWKEHLLNVFEEIYWSAMRIAFIEPAAGMLARGMTAGVGALLGIGAGAPGGPPTTAGVQSYTLGGYGGGLQHGGTVMQTGWAKVHRGETFSGVGEGGEAKFDMHIHNQGSEKLEISAVEEYMISDRRIIEVTMKAMKTNMKYRNSIAQIG